MMTMRAPRLTAVAFALAASAVVLSAQAGPPLAKAPRDTQPALIQLKPQSPPPASVAPRARAAAQVRAPATTDSVPRPMKQMSPPVDSVRPAPTPANSLDPRRAPPVQPPPPAPVSPSAAVQQVTTRASLVSDEPPIDATARCKDGTFVFTTVDATTCVNNGGLAVRMPARPTPPRRPNP